VLGASEQFACRVAGQHRATQRHEPASTTPDDPDAALRAWLRQYAKDHPRRGFRPAYHDARAEGWTVNDKKTQRLWRDEGLRVPQRRRRKRHGISTAPLTVTADAPNRVWAVDFQFDVTTGGRPVTIVSIIDGHTRECLGGMVERSITGEHLIAELDRLAARRGTCPAVPRCDNGPNWLVRQWPTRRTVTSACTSSRPDNRGAMATSNLSTPASATSASTSTASGHWPSPGRSSATGSTTTTTTDAIPPSVTSHRAATLPPAFIDVRRMRGTILITDEFFRPPQSS
jgi:Integrase core domain/HTH-like domain